MPAAPPKDLTSNVALRQLLQHDLTRIIDEEEVALDRAFLRLCVEYLGFDREAGVISDGPGDHGVDFIEADNSGASIIQSKSVDFDQQIDFERNVGSSQITDLPRIRSLFENLDGLPPKMNPHVKRALMDIRHHLHSLSESQRLEPFRVTVHFCAQAAGFTDAASAEFARLTTAPIAYGDVDVAITYHPVFLNDLLDAKWNQTNTKWRNKKNEKRDTFVLDVCGTLIRDSSKSCVFFTKASQLVHAYKDIGYQLFESNVRCEIKNSSVNKAIRASLLSYRGREEFKHLNNGITIVCDSFQHVGSREQPTGLRVTHPGVINGLQTIKTLADSVSEQLAGSGL